MKVVPFPVRLVERFDPRTRLFSGKRTQGRVIAVGTLGWSDSGLRFCAEESVPMQVVRFLAHCEEAAASGRLAERTPNPLAAGREIPLVFLEGHDVVADFDVTAGALRLGMDWTGDTSCVEGESVLLAAALLFGLSLADGRSQREALGSVIRFHRGLAADRRFALRRLLEGTRLDSGNLFAQFLSETLDPELDDHHLERRITWLLGQDRLDLPYPRDEIRAVLGSDLEPDEKRLGLYRVIRDYDPDVEWRNIERLARETRQAGRQLVFGRMSRAFHNQAALLADAVTLTPGGDLRALAEDLPCLEDSPAALQIAVQELVLLLKSEAEISLMQAEGALERFEEAVLDWQKENLLANLRKARLAVENHADPASENLPVHLDETEIAGKALDLLALAGRVRTGFLRCELRPAAQVIIGQRPSPTGAHLLARMNELQEPYAGKAENLAKLGRLAGERIYASPDFRWLQASDHWIEAIPLFIKEAVRVEGERVTTETAVDVTDMEASFREVMADHWARNLQDVMDRDLLALARQLIAVRPFAAADEALPDAQDIAVVALLLEALYRRRFDAVHRRVALEGIDLFGAMKESLLDFQLPSLKRLLARVEAGDSWRGAVTATERERELIVDWRRLERLAAKAFEARRPLPTLHVLTTQSAGMTEGFVRTWLEESMVLFNVIEAHGLERAVALREQFFARRLAALEEKILREAGRWDEVEAMASAEGDDASQAAQRLVAASPLLREEVGCLGVLLEALGEGDDPSRVAEPHEVQKVLAEGEMEPAPWSNDDAGGKKLPEAFRLRGAARRLVLERLAGQNPVLDPAARAAEYLRRRRALAKTTARREIIAEKGLAHLCLDPLYRFSATGALKRYHLLYAPSRVDLGERERESVEDWAQWIGGADRAATLAGRRLYGLINKSVQSYESPVPAEILKTGENAAMTAHLAFSNALGLMVSACRQGDMEAMGDQMNRRCDRLVHPAGEGYGGYCVPKDGLFLAFVLTLGREKKLDSMGVPAESRETVAALAETLLARRSAFVTDFEWERWASRQFGERADLPPLALTGIAEALNEFGCPQPDDSFRTAGNLAARWGVEKMVVGGEQVNRFMPFYKSWLLRQAVVEAQRRHPESARSFDECVVVLTAEYKPDAQDGRFSAGMRKFEILTGSGGHLRRALDAEGQALAALLSGGAPALMRETQAMELATRLGFADPSAARFAELFPVPPLAREIRTVSVMGLSTEDLLRHTGDSRLAEAAESARSELLDAGFSNREIDANLKSFGPCLRRWVCRAGRDDALIDALAGRLGGSIHALALRVLGPERSYERALQGADILDTGIPHRRLLALLEDPSQICDLMLEGNPASALAIVDGASGARHRAMNRLDVMAWFAASLRAGRQAVYIGIGVGENTVEQWRSEMLGQRQRAEHLGAAIIDGQSEAAHGCYREIVEAMKSGQEAQRFLQEADKLRRLGRGRQRDLLVGRSLARLEAGLPLVELQVEDFLALGGMFLLDGLAENEITGFLQAFLSGLKRLGGNPAGFSLPSLSPLIKPRSLVAAQTFQEEKGVESSNKAGEKNAERAEEVRRRLTARFENVRALNRRQTAFRSVAPREGDFDTAWGTAIAQLGSPEACVDDETFGRFVGLSRNAMFAFGREYLADYPELQRQWREGVVDLFSWRGVATEAWRRVAGSYEDIGIFGRVAQALAAGSGMDALARAGELPTLLLALHKTAGVDEPDALWGRLAEFFAETVNDHFYEYRPWLYARGVGFARFHGDALYSLAAERHEWLYRHLRFLITRFTEVRELSGAECDLLLGNGLSRLPEAGIGSGGASAAEIRWRAYGQLREIAFLRNDGHALPEVFAEFDPDLIDAENRINHLVAMPVGRTHINRMLQEGPTLNRRLLAENRRGANLLASRWFEMEGGRAFVESAHLYLDAETFRKALIRHRGVDQGTARRLTEGVYPKGVRVAVRFNVPVRALLVYPFHGHPHYRSGAMETIGLPYTIQSRFHTWTTYDKTKYKRIFGPESGVDLPNEIDWSGAQTQRAGDAATAKRRIEIGVEAAGFPGLRAFAERHGLVMIKDAAGSGGRGMKVFNLRGGDGSLDETALAEAVDFVYQLSLEHNVVLQEVIHASPEFWATEAFLASLVECQIGEFGHAVDRDRRPRTPLYGSHRVILSTDDPGADGRWHFSHWITLNSTQLITNVGRGGTLELFMAEYIRREYREIIMEKIKQAAIRVANALAAYEEKAAESYRQETGCPVGRDACGVSYGFPRYLMVDFLLAPVFAESGTLVDIRPRLDGSGRRVGSVFLLRQGTRCVPGTIRDWRVVLIEPNVGIGLWDRVALREEAHERIRAANEARPISWDAVGENARVVLADLHCAGERCLELEAAGSTERATAGPARETVLGRDAQ